MSEWPLEAERQLLADAGYNNFRFFLKHVLGIVRNPEGKSGNKLKWDEKIHGEFSDWAETRILAWERTRREGPMERHYLMIDAMRGFMKTLLVTQGLHVWIHLRNPDIGVVLSSVVQDFSEKVAEVIKEGWWSNKDEYCWFSWLYGSWESPRGNWTRRNMTHAARRVTRKEPSIECISVETGATGRHPEVVILDDPITPEKLKESGNWIKTAKTHVSSIFPVLLNDSLFIIVATPYRDNDVITSQMRDHGIREVHGVPLPPEYADFVNPETGRWYLFHMPALDEHEKPTLPSIWDNTAIEAFKVDDAEFYVSQLLLRPGSGARQLLQYDQIKNFITEEIPAAWPVSIHLDTALKEPDKKSTGDDNVILVAAHHPTDGRVCLVDCAFGNDWSPDDFDTHFVHLVEKWFKTKRRRLLGITDDATVGRGSAGSSTWKTHLENLLRDRGFYMPCKFYAINRSGKAKVKRISEAAVHWAARRVSLYRKMPGLSTLMWQMCRIGISEHDDLADAGADVFHAEIYKPIRVTTGHVQPPAPRLPFEEVLKSSRFGDEAARAAYDEYGKDQPPLDVTGMEEW